MGTGETSNGELIVRREIEIRSPAARVWEALTSSSYTRKYMFALDVDSDFKEGSPVIWTGDSRGIKTYRKGKVLEVEQGKFLKLSDFNPANGAADIEENYAHVCYKLKSSGSKTVLTVVTDHLNGDEARRKDSESFWDRVLPALKELLESEHGQHLHQPDPGR